MKRNAILVALLVVLCLAATACSPDVSSVGTTTVDRTTLSSSPLETSSVVEVTPTDNTTLVPSSPDISSADTTTINDRILAILDENRYKISEAEDLFLMCIESRDEGVLATLFYEPNWVAINDLLSAIPKLSEQLSAIEISSIQTDFIRESFAELVNVVASNAEIYSKTLEFYNLFYEYLKSDRTNAEIRNSIINFHENGSRLLGLADSFEVSVDAVSDLRIYIATTDFARELFTTFAGADYEKVGFTNYIGKVSAQIESLGD